jgi:predicted nucleotidyltransferase component of viral defense system
VIPRRELNELRGEWSLDIGVIEKDYVLGWLLAGIAQHPDLTVTWIFKGGTCLRKCYYETFRFSEDLDFTAIEDGPEEPDDLQGIFAEVGKWLREESGIELLPDAKAFQRRQNRRGHTTTQGRIAYRGPNETRGVPPKVKFDITSDEVLTQRPTLRPIGHHYSDQPLPVRGVAAYPITELFGEKLRALAERCRPRDLYDVVHLHRHPDLVGRASTVAAVLRDKCAHAGIDVPTLETMRATTFRDEIETEWENMLGHQLPRPLPPFADFWATLDEVFA